MFEPKLDTKTRELLFKRPIDLSYKQIAEETGLKERWIKNFAHNSDCDAGSRKVEQLYTYLTGQPLNV